MDNFSQHTEAVPTCKSCRKSLRDEQGPETTSAAALCQGCIANAAEVREFADTEGLRWAQMSARGRKWVDDGRSAQLQATATICYSDYLLMQPAEADEEMIQKDVLLGRTDPEVMNWPLRSLLEGVDLPGYRLSIASVLRAYCVRNPQIGYCQGMNTVAMWLLLFMDAEHAFWTLCNLVERILTPGFYMGGKTGNSLNGFYIESTVIAALLDYFMPAVRDSPLPVTDFTDCLSLQLLIQLFTISLDFRSVVFLWDFLFSEGSVAMIRGVVAIAYIFEEDISSGKHPSVIYQEITHKCLYSQLQAAYSRVRLSVTSLRVERLRRQARDYRALQWLYDKDITLKRLEYVSKFTQEEIIVFQQEFIRLLQEKREISEQLRVKIRYSRKVTVTLPSSLQTDMSNIEGSVDIGITRPEFYALLENLQTKMLAHFDRMFDFFDEDQSGYLDFREVIVCLSTMLKGSLEEKIHLLFDLFVSEQNKTLLKADFQRLIDALLLPYYEVLEQGFDSGVKQKVDSIYLALSPLSGSTSVTWAEFAEVARKNENVKQCLADYVRVKSASLGELVHGIVERKSGFPVSGQATAGCVQCTLM